PGTDDHVHDVVTKLSPKYSVQDGQLSVKVGGRAEVFRQVNTQIRSDLARAESIAIPVTLFLLIIVFGSLIAAGLPVAIGIVSIVGTLLILQLLRMFTQVSIFSLNL